MCFIFFVAKQKIHRQKLRMNEVYSIDATDLRLIGVLQKDGRITNQDLARSCGLSPAACHERVRRLREKGVIRATVALIEPKALDCDLLIFVEVVLDRTTNDAFRAFADHVRAIPEIQECHMVAGGFDYLIKARVSDMDAYRSFLGNILASVPGVRETRTYAVLEKVKESPCLPMPGRRTA